MTFTVYWIQAIFCLLSVVRAVDPPGPISFRDPEGHIVHDVSFMQYIATGDYTFQCTGTSGTWTIQPSLPSGVYMDSDLHTISGTPTMEMSKKSYNLTVTNEGGSSSLLFSIEVTTCSYGFYVMREVEDMRGGHFTLTYGGKVLEDSDYSIYTKDTYFCIPNGELSFSLSCTESSYYYCIGKVRSTTGDVYLHLVVQPGESQTASVSMIPTSVPSISVQPYYIFPSTTNVEFLLTVRGVYNSVSFDPSLPDHLLFSTSRLLISGSVAEGGVYPSKIIATNAAGTAEFPVVFYVDSCPEGEELVQLSSSASIQGSYAILSLNGTLLSNKSISSTPFKSVHCLKPGEYLMQMVGTSDKPTWENALLSHDVQGALLESFQKSSLGQYQEERFVVGTILSVCVHDTPLAIQKEFLISNPLKYSQILISMTTSSTTKIQLNSKWSHEIHQAGNARLYLPATCLIKGVNHISLQAVAAPLCMDVHLITSFCLKSPISGTATSDERFPVSGHLPEDAFSEGFSWWESHQIPVELHYRLMKDAMMPSLLEIGTVSSEEGRPLTFEVRGLVIDPSTNQTLVEDLIGSVSSSSFLVGTTIETVKLVSKQPYNAFRIRFVQSSGNQTMLIRGLSFSTCQEAVCKKKMGRPAVRVGSIITGRCSLGSYGIHQYLCGRQDVEPTWIEDRSMCLSKFSPNTLAFIDTGFSVSGVRKQGLGSIKKAALTLLPASLIVKEEEISFPIVEESENEEVALHLVVRFTVDKELGKYVEKTMKAFSSQFVEQMKNRLQTSVVITSEPTLFLPFPWSTIVLWIVVVVLVIVAFLLGLVCMSVCSRREPLISRKRLKKESLLDSV